MTRVLSFELENESYVIKENSAIVFTIDAKKLVFNSLDFYNGIYKGEKSTQIDLKGAIQDDIYKNGTYIYNWIKDIVCRIAEEFKEVETVDEIDQTVEAAKVIKYPASDNRIKQYELSACGGDGNFMGNEAVPFKYIEVENQDADYAVAISGQSMEPTFPDECVLLVKDVDELNNNEVGIFLIDGTSTCKRYHKHDDGSVTLTPDNDSGKFKPVQVDSYERGIIQGRVLGILEE